MVSGFLKIYIAAPTHLFNGSLLKESLLCITSSVIIWFIIGTWEQQQYCYKITEKTSKQHEQMSIISHVYLHISLSWQALFLRSYPLPLTVSRADFPGYSRDEGVRRGGMVITQQKSSLSRHICIFEQI